MEKIRVGVIGAGYFGQFHIEKYLKMDGVELVGVVDIDPSRCKEIARRYAVQTFPHHSDLFGKVQSVSIATPTSFHHAIAKDFFLRGVDVLLEKPIASTLEEADELIALSEEKNLILQIGHLERFNGAFVAAERWIRNPILIESQRLTPFSGRGIEVNVVLDLMVHDIDIVLYLLPSKVKNLDATGLSVLTSSADVAYAHLEFENGCRAHLTASRISQEKVRQTRIFQPDVALTLDYLSQGVRVSKKIDRFETGERSEMVLEDVPVRKVDLLEEEIRSFLESVRDRKKPKVSGHEGRKVLEVALAITHKIEKGSV